MMSNFELAVEAQGLENLRHCLTLLVNNKCPGNKVTHWGTLDFDYKGTKCLALYWHEDTGATPLAYPHTLDEIINFVQGWLNHAEYGERPDIDGSCSKGWLIRSELPKGHNPYLSGIIVPIWAEHHK